MFVHNNDILMRPRQVLDEFLIRDDPMKIRWQKLLY